MANEAEIINNPTSTPAAVSTGYQAQNTNMVAVRVGCDNTVVEGGTGDCTLKLSGPVDVSGTLYTINTDVTFTLTTAGAYYIHLNGSGDNLTPTIGTITTYPHTFDPDKNARYTDTGSYRVLNWIIYYDGTTAYAHRIDPLHELPISYPLVNERKLLSKLLTVSIVGGETGDFTHGISLAKTNKRILLVCCITYEGTQDPDTWPVRALWDDTNMRLHISDDLDGVVTVLIHYTEE